MKGKWGMILVAVWKMLILQAEELLLVWES